MLTVVHNETIDNKSILALLSYQSLVYYEVKSERIPLGLKLGSTVLITDDEVFVDNSEVKLKVKPVYNAPCSNKYDLPKPIEIFYDDVLVGYGYFNYLEDHSLCYVDLFNAFSPLYRTKLEYIYDAVLDIIILK